MNNDHFLVAASRQITPNQAAIVTYLELLGPFGMHVVLTALVAFILTVLILWRGKGHFAGAALVLVAFSPLMVGTFAGLHLATRSLLDIASFAFEAGDKWSLKPAEHYMLALDAISPITTALFLSAPTYLVAMVGACVKAWRGRGDIAVASK